MAPRSEGESPWRWVAVAALAITVPAFYLELQQDAPGWVADAAYVGAALVLLATHRWGSEHSATRRWRGLAGLELALAPALLVAALLPSSHHSGFALAWRLALAVPIVLHLAGTLRPLLVRGGIFPLLALGAGLFAVAGVGFWWLEPTALTYADGLWLAFATGATVGYGDIVPTTPSAKIFAVFVVLLGYGMLSVVTAGIAALLVRSQEQRVERDILDAMHRELRALREEVARLREERDGRSGRADR